jgi:hypothetical protein
MALVGFGCKEELEGDIGGRGWVVQECMGLVMRADVGAESAGLPLCEVSGLRSYGAWGGRMDSRCCLCRWYCSATVAATWAAGAAWAAASVEGTG